MGANQVVGVFEILAAIAVDRALDLASEDAGSAESMVQLMTRKDTTYQRWLLTKHGDLYTIRLEGMDNKYLQPEEHQGGNGDEIVAAGPDGTDFQKWFIESVSDNGLLRLQNQGSKKYLMVAGPDVRTQPEQYAYENESGFHWSLNQKSGPALELPKAPAPYFHPRKE